MPPYSTIAGTGHLEQVPHHTKTRRPFSLRRQRPNVGYSSSNSSKALGSSSSVVVDAYSADQYVTVQETQEHRAFSYIRDASQKLDKTMEMLGHLLQSCGGVSRQAVEELQMLPTPYERLQRAQMYLMCVIMVSNNNNNNTNKSKQQQHDEDAERQALLVMLVQAWEALVRVRHLEQKLHYRKLNTYKLNGGATSYEIKRASEKLTTTSEACTQALVGLWKVQRLIKKTTKKPLNDDDDEDNKSTATTDW
uniref:Uncharacterized protein n=1 Tax=Grammatophora oceanica TaxID=210454 RepID=A0A7S1Y1C1_9STRA